MIVMAEERLVESPYIEWVAHGYTVAGAVAMRPAEYNWHLIFTRQAGILRTLVVGALEAARPLHYTDGAESLWIRFKAGTFMPHLPSSTLLNREVELSEDRGNRFWLKDRVWQIPTYENVDIFITRLVREGILTSDPLVKAALHDELSGVPSRTVRHRFQHSIGLRQTAIHQIDRAHRAAELLKQGVGILDTVHALGYADQPHLNRSLKRFLGHTPRELLTASSP